MLSGLKFLLRDVTQLVSTECALLRYGEGKVKPLTDPEGFTRFKRRAPKRS